MPFGKGLGVIEKSSCERRLPAYVAVATATCVSLLASVKTTEAEVVFPQSNAHVNRKSWAGPRNGLSSKEQCQSHSTCSRDYIARRSFGHRFGDATSLAPDEYNRGILSVEAYHLW
jgi:hypothetical protein